MKNFIGIVVGCCCLILSQGLFSQDAAQTMELSKELADRNPRGAWQLAERVVFFARGDTLYRAYLWWGDLSLQLGEYVTAEKAYRRASLFGEGHPSEEAIYRWVAAQILQRQWQEALWTLENYGDSLSSTYWILKGTAYWGMESDSAAMAAFYRAADSTQQLQIASILSRLRRYQRPRPLVAYILSLFLPGAGQAYAGYWKEAFNSFLLVGGLGMLSLYLMVKYSLIDAAGVGAWAYRYYYGGAQKAEQLARRRRQIKRKKAYEQIHSILLDVAHDHK